MSSSPAVLRWADIAEGDALPAVTIEVTLRRVVMNAGASWDTFPGHFDREYARAQGHRDVFANTSLLLSFADRVITEWAGPASFIRRRKLTMQVPVYPGDQLSGAGRVVARRQDGDVRLVDVDIELTTQAGACAHAAATVAIAADSSANPRVKGTP